MTDNSQNSQVSELISPTKPKLRGVLHLVAFPVALFLGTFLVIASKGSAAKISCAIYGASIAILFGISALYHRGKWTRGPHEILQRIDHADIYIAIAGSYTPICVLALGGTVSTVVLTIVWTGAFVGIVLSMLWPKAPRIVLVPTYLVVGWTAIAVLPQLTHGGGIAMVVLILVSGAFYTLGGIVYSMRKPNPAPNVFGFHEVFHSFTIAGWITQYVAISLIAYRI